VAVRADRAQLGELKCHLLLPSRVGEQRWEESLLNTIQKNLKRQMDIWLNGKSGDMGWFSALP